MNGIVLWIAQGFGIGRVRLAPGTFGSLVGLLWLGLLLLSRNFWVYAAGTAAGLVLSVWVCHVAERVLQQKDPGSVVFDEMAAIPLCFLGWIGIVFFRTGTLPSPEYFIGPRIWPLTVGVFVAFRFFDVLKPWPVHQSQALRGGLGVTADDTLAAVYVNAMVLAAYVGSTYIKP